MIQTQLYESQSNLQPMEYKILSIGVFQVGRMNTEDLLAHCLLIYSFSLLGCG